MRDEGAEMRWGSESVEMLVWKCYLSPVFRMKEKAQCKCCYTWLLISVQVKSGTKYSRDKHRELSAPRANSLFSIFLIHHQTLTHIHRGKYAEKTHQTMTCHAVKWRNHDLPSGEEHKKLLQNKYSSCAASNTEKDAKRCEVKQRALTWGIQWQVNILRRGESVADLDQEGGNRKLNEINKTVLTQPLSKYCTFLKPSRQCYMTRHPVKILELKHYFIKYLLHVFCLKTNIISINRFPK